MILCFCINVAICNSRTRLSEQYNYYYYTVTKFSPEFVPRYFILLLLSIQRCWIQTTPSYSTLVCCSGGRANPDWIVLLAVMTGYTGRAEQFIRYVYLRLYSFIQFSRIYDYTIQCYYDLRLIVVVRVAVASHVL